MLTKYKVLQFFLYFYQYEDKKKKYLSDPFFRNPNANNEMD